MFKIGLRPQLNGDNQGQGDGSDSNWPDGNSQGQSDGFDSYGPGPVPGTGSNMFATGTASSSAGGSNGAGSGAGSGGSTIVSNGGNLIFNNTYDASCTTAFEACIVAAELTLESLFTPSINPLTLDVTFKEANNGNNNGLLGNTWNGVNVTYAQLKSVLPASDSLPATDPNPTGGMDWHLPEAYARMLGLGGAPTLINGVLTDVTVTLNSHYNWSFTQDVVNGLEHELSEGGMGRVGGLGTLYSTMDLFRYAAAGVPDYSNGRDGATTYFSSDGYNLSSLSFHNQYDSNGKFYQGDNDDWNQLAVFGSGSLMGTSFTLVPTELDVMQALGWNLQTQEDFWVGGSGNWWDVNTTDWSGDNTGTDYVPITPQDAFIGFFNTATVTSSNNETVNSIGTNTTSTLIIANDSTFTATNGTVLNPADSGLSGLLGTLDVDPGSTLVIGDTFDNAGTLTVGDNYGNGDLQILGSVTLNGGGTVNLGQYINQGKFSFVSTGTIETYPGSTNFFVNGALVNVNNTITGGGTIGLYSFDNQAGGTVDASQEEGNYLQVYGTSSFTNEGLMVAATRATLDLGQDGATISLTNTGATEAIAPSKGIYLDGDLAISGNFTIAGSGDIGMKGAGADIVSDGFGAATFTNESNIDAIASGQIGDVGVLGVNDLTFDNDGGTVLVLGSGNTLTLNTGSHTITDNFGGTFLAENGAQMVIDSNVNTGGLIFFGGRGTIEAAAGSEVTVSAAIAPGGSGLFFEDGEVLISGNGTINLASGGSISTPITFSGGGGTLQVDSASDSVTGQISGFAAGVSGIVAGDFIDARFMPFTSKVTAQWVENGGGTAGTLTLSNGSGTTMTFNLNGNFLPFFNFKGIQRRKWRHAGQPAEPEPECAGGHRRRHDHDRRRQPRL